MKIRALYKSNGEYVPLRLIHIDEDGNIFAIEDKDGQLDSLKTVDLIIEIE